MKETCGLQRLREEVRIVVGTQWKQTERQVDPPQQAREQNNVSYLGSYVLRPRVILRVVGGVNRCLVVKG